jgi:drug/metabolite transporter (DMT)-like permease
MESSDLSQSMPILSFTPVFLIGTSSLLLHEEPSAAGIAGICIIVSGLYVLNISAEHEYFPDPLKSMVQNRGTWYMLIAALLFAISINGDKIAMLNPGPGLWHGIHSADCQRCVCGHRYPLPKIRWILFPAPSLAGPGSIRPS